MEKMTLCAKCLSRMQVKNIVRQISRNVDEVARCEVCKTFKYIALYEVEPKRNKKETGNENQSET